LPELSAVNTPLARERRHTSGNHRQFRLAPAPFNGSASH
jgi:hypothetical protein